MEIQSSLQQRFPELAADFDLTGHQLASEALENLPNPMPERSLPSILDQAIKLLGDKPALVKAFGYRNVTKGLRRLDAWMAGEEFPGSTQLPALASALRMGRDDLKETIDSDKNIVRLWAIHHRAQDPACTLTVRLMAAVYQPTRLAPDLTLKQALEKACKIDGPRKCLSLPTGVHVYISGSGTLESYADESPSGGLRFCTKRLTSAAHDCEHDSGSGENHEH